MNLLIITSKTNLFNANIYSHFEGEVTMKLFDIMSAFVFENEIY